MRNEEVSHKRGSVHSPHNTTTLLHYSFTIKLLETQRNSVVTNPNQSKYYFYVTEKEELTEVLETIHYTLFGVMLIFVLEVLLLIHAGNYLEAEWLEMNDDVQSPGYRERTEKELETVKRPKWYSRYALQLSDSK